MKRIDITGMVYGKLTAVSFKCSLKKRTLWNCKCECGNTSVASLVNLKSGATKSCGCSKATIKHGFSKHGARHPEYNIWIAMRARCFNEKDKNYHNYGGRGITVCDRWCEPDGSGIKNFIYDMGLRPSKKHSIERLDNNGNYCPKNCAWRTQSDQTSNQRSNRKVIDVSTNNIYPTMASAARSINLSSGYLREMLIGENTNKTTMKLL